MSEQLQGGVWVVEAIDNEEIDGSKGTLSFTADGTVSGRSFCNNYNGSYTLSGQSLTIGRVASTKMACPPPEMELERAFADILTHVSRFELAEDSALVLHTEDGRTMTAHLQK